MRGAPCFAPLQPPLRISAEQAQNRCLSSRTSSARCTSHRSSCSWHSAPTCALCSICSNKQVGVKREVRITTACSLLVGSAHAWMSVAAAANMIRIECNHPLACTAARQPAAGSRKGCSRRIQPPATHCGQPAIINCRKLPATAAIRTPHQALGGRSLLFGIHVATHPFSVDRMCARLLQLHIQPQVLCRLLLLGKHQRCTFARQLDHQDREEGNRGRRDKERVMCRL